MTKTEAGKIARRARRYGTTTLVHRGGRTFKVEYCRAVDGLPRGWVVSERDVEPGITWTFVSGAWGTKREAMATIPSTEKKKEGSAMMHEGHAVRLSGTNLHGYTRRYDSATGGNRWWLCEWEDGTASVAAEAVLVDVERQEWADAMRGVAEHLRCPSIGAGSAAGGRRCEMREGHRTPYHRDCEISWVAP